MSRQRSRQGGGQPQVLVVERFLPPTVTPGHASTLDRGCHAKVHVYRLPVLHPKADLVSVQQDQPLPIPSGVVQRHRTAQLRDITELHSLGAYIRLAATKPAFADELRHRIQSLRTGDTSVRWRSIP